VGDRDLLPFSSSSLHLGFSCRIGPFFSESFCLHHTGVLIGEFLEPGEYIDELVLYITDRFAIYY
jgi:hypothetical protein